VTDVAVARTLPIENDHDTGGFWEAARRHELAVRFCDDCGAVLHLPRAYCHECGSWDGSWKAVTGKARLHSWTNVTHQIHPHFPVPYTILLVELDELPSIRFVGSLQGDPDLYENQPMEVWFETLDDGTTLPQWRAATNA
jgi:uncharacterized OB-fold protein